jgi:hypothetical protein
VTDYERYMERKATEQVQWMRTELYWCAEELRAIVRIFDPVSSPPDAVERCEAILSRLKREVLG